MVSQAAEQDPQAADPQAANIDEARTALDKAGFMDRQRQIGDTMFRFDKMDALVGYEVLELLRTALGHNLGDLLDVDMDNPMQMFGKLLSAVGVVSPQHMNAVRNAMFEYVTFTNKSVTNGTKLISMEGMAFADLEPVHVYEVLLRALCVNFRASFSVIGLQFGSESPSSP